MRKLESKYMSCVRVPYNECNWYAVVVHVVKDGVVVRLLSKTVSKLLAEVHALKKGTTFELNSSFKNTRLINFHGFIDQRKFYNNEKFPDYGICSTGAVIFYICVGSF